MLSDRCPVRRSVTFLLCGQTVGRIKTKLGMQVGLGPGHNVLDGDPAPSPPNGHSPQIFGPYLLQPNGCVDQDVTWYRARPRSRRLCVRWGSRCPFPKRGGGPPKFSADVYFDQTAGWMKLILGMVVGHSQASLCYMGTQPPPPKVAEPLLNFKG